jgi:hypothetical protein
MVPPPLRARCATPVWLIARERARACACMRVCEHARVRARACAGTRVCVHARVRACARVAASERLALQSELLDLKTTELSLVNRKLCALEQVWRAATAYS